MDDFSHDEQSTVSTATPCVGPLHWRLLYAYSCIDLPANASLKDRVVTYIMQFRTKLLQSSVVSYSCSSVD